MQESQWLLKLHTYGLLRNSFHPAAEIRIIRTYEERHREQQVQLLKKRTAKLGLQIVEPDAA